VKARTKASARMLRRVTLSVTLSQAVDQTFGGNMLEPSGNVELLVVEIGTGDEEQLLLTSKDFHPERRSMLDDDVMRDDDESEFVAYANALGYDFKVVATPPNHVDIEDDPEEIRVDIVENTIEFVDIDDDDDAED
jgi:hypothetical protein